MTNYGTVRLSVLCCDSIIEQSTNFLLDETDCVPFQNAFLLPSGALNLYGKMIPMIWSNKDLYSEFQFPRKVEKNKLIWYPIL